jgi:hypothetical protein
LLPFAPLCFARKQCLPFLTVPQSRQANCKTLLAESAMLLEKINLLQTLFRFAAKFWA